MRIPRDLSGQDLVRALAKLGYVRTRQKGSHIRLTTSLPSQHHVTVPDHDPVSIGTLRSILDSVAAHVGMSRDELMDAILD